MYSRRDDVETFPTIYDMPVSDHCIDLRERLEVDGRLGSTAQKIDGRDVNIGFEPIEPAVDQTTL